MDLFEIIGQCRKASNETRHRNLLHSIHYFLKKIFKTIDIFICVFIYLFIYFYAVLLFCFGEGIIDVFIMSFPRLTIHIVLLILFSPEDFKFFNVKSSCHGGCQKSDP